VKACDVTGCGNASRSPRSAHCEKHYYRLRRRGTLGAAPWHRRGGPCSAEGCKQPEYRHGWCEKHLARVLRHGDADFIPYGERAKRGRDHPQWRGDDVGYGGFHRRLRSLRGRAADHPCADCGGQAQHWSYDRSDPRQRETPEGPYSTDPARYVPRCVPCHKAFDLRHLALAP
jgi:hypothetical protein